MNRFPGIVCECFEYNKHRRVAQAIFGFFPATVVCCFDLRRFGRFTAVAPYTFEVAFLCCIEAAIHIEFAKRSARATGTFQKGIPTLASKTGRAGAFLFLTGRILPACKSISHFCDFVCRCIGTRRNADARGMPPWSALNKISTLDLQAVVKAYQLAKMMKPAKEHMETDEAERQKS